MSQQKKRIAKFVGGPADEFELIGEWDSTSTQDKVDVCVYVRSGRTNSKGHELWIVDASDKE